MSKFNDKELKIRTDRLAEARIVRSQTTLDNDNKLLKIIYAFDNTTIGDLVKRTDFKRTYLVNALRRLCEKNLIDYEIENHKNQLRYRYTTKNIIFSGTAQIVECPK